FETECEESQSERNLAITQIPSADSFPASPKAWALHPRADGLEQGKLRRPPFTSLRGAVSQSSFVMGQNTYCPCTGCRSRRAWHTYRKAGLCSRARRSAPRRAQAWRRWPANYPGSAQVRISHETCPF